MVRRKVLNKRDDSKGSGDMSCFPMRSPDKILKDAKLDPGMRCIMAFLNGAKIEPEQIFKGDFFNGDKPDDTGHKTE
ncbi:MAG: hypothetical protein GY852_04575 [bacterium]|nr:hypothetical protein [bacterium]